MLVLIVLWIYFYFSQHKVSLGHPTSGLMATCWMFSSTITYSNAESEFEILDWVNTDAVTPEAPVKVAVIDAPF